MSESDRELLELAAKAAEIKGVWSERGQCLVACEGRGCSYDWWRPLEDDGDAFRLAVKLGFIVDIDVEEHYTEVEFTSNYEDKSTSEGHAFDAMAATRRAIVRAAAAIGETLP